MGKRPSHRINNKFVTKSIYSCGLHIGSMSLQIFFKKTCTLVQGCVYNLLPTQSRLGRSQNKMWMSMTDTENINSSTENQI